MANPSGTPGHVANNQSGTPSIHQTPTISNNNGAPPNGKSYQRGRWHVMDFENNENKQPQASVNVQPLPQPQQQHTPKLNQSLRSNLSMNFDVTSNKTDDSTPINFYIPRKFFQPLSIFLVILNSRLNWSIY